MKEKILELLKTKFTGVSEITLSRMAEKASKTATTEEQVQTYVDGVSFQGVIDSEADYRATKATQTSVENYEKKYNIKEGKPVEAKKEEPPAKPEETPDVPEWAKGLLAFANSYAEDKKAQNEKASREKVVEKLLELGVNKNDKGVIENLVKVSSITPETNVEEKATEILAVYNAFKKPEGDNNTPPRKPDEKAEDDAFEALLKQAKGE